MSTIRVEAGDMLETLPRLIAEGVRFDSVVTDPPYHLTSIVKRFSADNAAPAIAGKTGAYARASAGFMGQKWDGGDIAFRPETWRLVFDAMKPGAHLVAFSGTRTYHRMVCAIEDAGFEIRDQLAWVFGSGFPKSHNVGKAIDKAAGVERAEGELRTNGRGAWNLKLDNHGAGDTGIEHADGSKKVYREGIPATADAARWEGWGTALKPAWEPIVLARKPLAGTIAANVLAFGTGSLNIDACRVSSSIGQRPVEVNTWAKDQRLCRSCAEAAEVARQHGQQETRESIATSNVGPTTSERASLRQHATSKPDIGCSAGTPEAGTATNSSTAGYGKAPTGLFPPDTTSTTGTATEPTTGSKICSACRGAITRISTGNTEPRPTNSRPAQDRPGSAAPESAPPARWPANLLHDGSPEVVGMFPSSGSGTGAATVAVRRRDKGWANSSPGEGVAAVDNFGDAGSAARFFYSAKADAADRLGSKHPTVKPVDLMRWLVRLVTPPGGLVLDPFGGSGSTAMACMAEGFDAILCERDAAFVADIKRRIAHVSGEDGDLFATAAD